MNQVSKVSLLGSLEALDHAGELASVESPATTPSPDVFSQKIGRWAFATPAGSSQNTAQELPNAFALRPIDGGVMDYLESFLGQSQSLPVAYLYDSALSAAADTIAPGHPVKELLLEDIALRDYLRSRKIGDVYE